MRGILRTTVHSEKSIQGANGRAAKWNIDLPLELRVSAPAANKAFRKDQYILTDTVMIKLPTLPVLLDIGETAESTYVVCEFIESS